MTGKTSIEWCSAVWNPTTGCSRVSAGCDHCYAFALHDQRYAANLRCVVATLGISMSDARAVLESGQFRADHPALVGAKDGISGARQYDRPFSQVQLLPDRLSDPQRHKKPERYFVDSMADLFHEDVPDAFIAEVFDSMARARWHTFLILTKRPERMRAWVTERGAVGPGIPKLPGGYGWLTSEPWPLPNVWLGTSVEDQRAADERIPHLLATPAAVRFLSCEPLIGPVDLPRWGGWGLALHWVIVGGESGPRARPMDLAWARSLVDQCRAAGVAPFVKQMGSTLVGEAGEVMPTGSRMDARYADGFAQVRWLLRESHGRDMAEWPEDLRVRELPNDLPFAEPPARESSTDGAR